MASISCLILFGFSSQVAHAEDVTFIVPGSKDPRSVQFFDPAIQIIEKDQTIVFVNPDSEKHRLVVKSDNDSEQVFDTGVLESSNFVAYAFSEYGTYSLECTIYPHMKSKITVTDDIATFSKSIPEHNLDVQLSRSPANPGVDETAFFKLIFIDKASGKNHAHIDYTLAFDDSSGQRVDGMGGHTVDGAEYGEFSFSEEATFTPRVTVSGINFIPVSPATVEFTAIVTPEFPAIVVTVIMAVFIGSLALYGRKIGRRINDYSP